MTDRSQHAGPATGYGKPEPPIRRPAIVLPLLLATVATLSCGRDDGPGPAAGPVPAEAAGLAPAGAAGPLAPDPLFVDVTSEVGLDFVHWNGMTGKLYFVEPVGSGGALVDFDDDGDLDVFVAQGRLLAPREAADGPREEDSVFPPPTRRGGRVYRNDLHTDADGRSVLRFVDVTDASGLVADGYGMGVASGDFDNDGRTDLYLTSFGSNQLWRNVSDGGGIHFENVTEAAGVDAPRWSTSTAFADFDADGWLDLFVVNYVDFRLENHKVCRSSGGRPDYCGPASYDGLPDRLFHNRGDGTFADVTGTSGILEEPSSGLGTVAADFDLDGRLDLYVANDLRRNHLWRNVSDDGGLRFENIGLESGSAVSGLGLAQASMGVVAGDLDRDGDDDLFMTHLTGDTNTLYLNDGTGSFDDRSSVSGLGTPSFTATSFGVALTDYDRDTWPDLVVANGAVKVLLDQARSGEVYPLKQLDQLFRNRGAGRFEEVSERAGEALTVPRVSRGVAVGDVDNDGRTDLLLLVNSGPARLLVNRSPDDNAWIGLRVLEAHGRDALGARIAVVRPGGSILWHRVATDGSYLSASDPRLLVGLGSDPEIEAVRVTWLGGGTEEWRGLEPGRYHTLRAGEGRPVPAPAP